MQIDADLASLWLDPAVRENTTLRHVRPRARAPCARSTSHPLSRDTLIDPAVSIPSRQLFDACQRVPKQSTSTKPAYNRALTNGDETLTNRLGVGQRTSFQLTVVVNPKCTAFMQLAFDGGMFILVYLAGVAKSWFYWPVLAGAMFLWKFKGAKSSFDEKHPGQLALAWPIDGDVRATSDAILYLTPEGMFVQVPSPCQAHHPCCRTPV